MNHRCSHYGWPSHYQFICCWSQMVLNPQRTSSKHREPPADVTSHPGAICPPGPWVNENEATLRFSPSFPTSASRVTTLSIQPWGCLNVQVLFVHSVDTHVCQKELLQYRITALTTREHHSLKRETCLQFSLYVVFQGGGVTGYFYGILFWWLFRTLYWQGPYFTVRL